MQLYLRLFYNNLRHQKKHEWTPEHQKRSDEIKTLLTEQISNTIPDHMPSPTPMPYPTPLTLELAQHFCNHIEASTECFQNQQFQDFLHKQN